MRAKVSVIIPVYNAEKYIEKCIRTLFNQTLDSLEFIFINDCTPDKSIQILKEVLDEFPDRKPQVHIIEHKTNKGVGRSRQDGLELASGEYIIHCDPDDWMDLDYYETLYITAKKNNSNVVIIDYCEETYNDSRLKVVELSENKKSIFKQIVRSRLHLALWNKLIKNSVAKNFKFPDGINMWEDQCIMIPILLTESNIDVSHQNSHYHYRTDNITSYINVVSYENALSQIKSASYVSSFIEKNNLLSTIDYNDLLYLQWRAKRKIISNPSTDNLQLWRNTFKSVNKNYLSIGLPLKSKILTFLLATKIDFIAKAIIKIYDYQSSKRQSK